MRLRDSLRMVDQAHAELRARVHRQTIEWHPHAAAVARRLAAAAVSDGDAGAVLRGVGVSLPSVISRYQRRGLPSPKHQLVLFRLWLAFVLLDRGHTVTDLWWAIGFESPQGFRRHFREQVGAPPARHLRTTPPGRAARWWRDRVDPAFQFEHARWTTFDPLGPGRAPAPPAAARRARHAPEWERHDREFMAAGARGVTAPKERVA